MKKLLIIFLFLLFSTNTFAETKIVYIDINKILNNSNVGQKTIKTLDLELKNSNEKFKKIEEELKKEESGIIAKKNVLSDEDFNKKIFDLRKKINNYRNERSSNINNFNEKKILLTKNFVKIINPIIADYASKNDISIVIRKEHMIVGKTELDISDEILILVNKKVKEIK
tara:strand:- start:783 stop:1292 length:510 start_codon:yes stop_codon:yes gene_type:complete